MTRTRMIALLAAALLLVFAPAVSAQSDTGTATVVHGIPGTTVDVYVNGDATLEGYEPGTITDPLELPAGAYDIEIYPARANVDNEDPVVSGSADLTAGANVSLVDLPTSDLFRREGRHQLVLVTCGGQFDASTRHYQDNLVVIATPAP